MQSLSERWGRFCEVEVEIEASAGEARRVETIRVDPHRASGQIAASLVRRFQLPNEHEYDLLSGDGDWLQAQRPLALQHRPGPGRRLRLAQRQAELRVESFLGAQRENRIVRLDADASVASVVDMLALQSPLPRGSEYGLALQRSGSQHAEFLDDSLSLRSLPQLRPGDTLRLAPKPKSTQVRLPDPLGVKSVPLVFTDPASAAVSRIVTRHGLEVFSLHINLYTHTYTHTLSLALSLFLWLYCCLCAADATAACRAMVAAKLFYPSTATAGRQPPRPGTTRFYCM
jgi:hypothetical protein